MKLIPVGDRILVRRKAADEQIGMIHVPEKARELPAEGTVVAVGPGKQLDNGRLSLMPFKVGEQVLFGRYSGVKVVSAGEEFLLLATDEILARLEQDEEIVH